MITIVTAWYSLKNKFDITTYMHWIDNFLSNANCNIVIFTDKMSKNIVETYTINKPNIKLIIKEINEFYTFKYRDKWISNQNVIYNPLKDKISWELNMLWNEKINFVKEASLLNLFNTDYFAWCDIGYFRCRPDLDIDIDLIRKWPNYEKINSLNTTKIYYNMVNHLCPTQGCNPLKSLPCCNNGFINQIASIIKNKNSQGLPIVPIPPRQVSIAGGFFLLHKNLIESWHTLFYNKLQLYFDNNYLVKDDQIIIIDCIVSNYDKFSLIQQNRHTMDRWFSFSTFLL